MREIQLIGFCWNIEAYGFVFLTAIGLFVIFLANGGTRGTRFLEKYFPLAFTVGYKYGVAIIVAEQLCSLLKSSISEITVISSYFVLNIAMIFHIAWRMHEVASAGRSSDSAHQHIPKAGFK